MTALLASPSPHPRGRRSLSSSRPRRRRMSTPSCCRQHGSPRHSGTSGPRCVHPIPHTRATFLTTALGSFAGGGDLRCAARFDGAGTTERHARAARIECEDPARGPRPTTRTQRHQKEEETRMDLQKAGKATRRESSSSRDANEHHHTTSTTNGIYPRPTGRCGIMTSTSGVERYRET